MVCVNCTAPTIDRPTLFLGLSIKEFSANVGWNGEGSSLSVTLINNKCSEPKDCWNECLMYSGINGPDPGFLGEDLWERPDGSRYTSCLQEDIGHTLVRSAINIIGVPSYFRVGTGDCSFEWCGIIQNWQRTDDCESGNSFYNIEIVGPEVIINNVQLILSKYNGCVNQYIEVGSGGTGCPSYNVFNVFGFLEHYSDVYCPPMVQGVPTQYSVLGTSGLSGAGLVDGVVFGTPNGGFGGSYWNESGLPFGTFINGFNALVNSVGFLNTAIEECYSPYGRVCGEAAIGLSGLDICGLMDPDTGINACSSTKDLYYVDINELKSYVPANYRMNYDVVSVGELIDTLSSEFNFNYYWDLVAFQDGVGSGCVDKIIKLRTVDRTINPNLDQICDFVSAHTNCVSSKTVGQELRTDSSAKYLIGAKKQTIYQATQNTNPDDASDCTINCIPTTKSIRGSFLFDVPVRLDSNGKPFIGPSGGTTISIQSYPPVDPSGSICCEIDDIIIPYFGQDNVDNAITACKDNNGDYFVDIPISRLGNSLREIKFSSNIIRVSELEMRAALAGFSEWELLITSLYTDTGIAIYSSGESASLPLGNLFSIPNTAQGKLARDTKNPTPAQAAAQLTNNNYSEYAEDKQKIYNFINGIAQQYYGAELTVRIPFVCCALDPETGKTRITSQPTNDGGWSEVSTVIGLPNVGPTIYSDFLSAYFREVDGKICPFVKYSNGLLKDVSNIPLEEYMYWYTLSDLTGVTSASGEPVAPPGNPIYIDTNTNSIYSYYPQGEWRLLQEVKIASGRGAPGPSGFCTSGGENSVVGIYIDEDTDTTYIATSINGDGCVVFDKTATFDLYVKAQVQEDYVFYDRANCCAPKAVVKVKHQIFEKTGIDTVLSNIKVDGLAKVIDNVLVDPSSVITKDKIKDLLKSISPEDTFFTLKPKACYPDSAAIPIIHHDLRYGPWGNPTSSSQGNVPVIDDTMNPWNFGSYSNLNTIAGATVNNARSDTRVGEIGQVTLVGAPCNPLGAELGALDGGYYAGAQLVENRNMDSSIIQYTDPSGIAYAYQYYGIDLSGLNVWTGIYGPNITSINTTIGEDGCAITKYSMRSYTPRPAEGYLKNARLKIDTMQRNIQFLKNKVDEMTRLINGL